MSRNYHAITMSRNYYRKLSAEIITENYELVYQSRGKCDIYWDTGVSKNIYHVLNYFHKTTLQVRTHLHSFLNFIFSMKFCITIKVMDRRLLFLIQNKIIKILTHTSIVNPSSK